MAGSEDDDDLEELKLTVKDPKKNLMKSSDEDDLSSSGESDFSDTRMSEEAKKNVFPGKQEEISLDSDIGNVMRLQKQLQSLQRQLDREKSNRTTVENKRTSLENDNKLLNQKVETLNKDKRSVEQVKIELEAKMRSLQLNLTEEHERRKNAEMMANRAKEQLARNDEQCKVETFAKQKCEMMIRSLQVQLNNANATLQQIEKEKNDFWQKASDSQSSLIAAKSPRDGACNKDDIISQKLDEDIFAQTTLQYNEEIVELKNENGRLKKIIGDIERSKSELENLRSILARTTSSLEMAEKRNSDLERSNDEATKSFKEILRLRDEETNKVREEFESQAQILKDIQLKLGKSEREEENYQQQVKMESLQEKVNKLQDEISKLNQNLEDEKQKVRCSEEHNLLITEQKTDQEKALNEIESKYDVFNQIVEELKNKLNLIGHNKEAVEKDLQVTQEMLAEAQQQIILRKMAFEEIERAKNHVQSERDQLLKKLDQLGEELKESKRKLSISDQLISDLTGQLQKTNNNLAESNRALKTKQEELLIAMHQLEQNNAKLKDIVTEDEMSHNQASDDGKEGRRQKRYDLNQKSPLPINASDNWKIDGHSRSRSDTELKNTTIGKEVTKLKAQMLHAKKQLKMGTDICGEHLAEIEARIRLDLNAKLAGINQYIQEHADACKKIDLLKERSTKTIRNEFSTLEMKLQDELHKLKQAQIITMSKKEIKEPDQEPLQLKDLCDSETSVSDHMGTGSDTKPVTTNSQVVIQPSFNAKHTSVSVSTGLQTFGTTWPLCMSLSGLPFNIKQQLERSIAKHLEKAPQFNILSAHHDHGLTVAATLNQPAHDYASILKRNYLFT